MTNEPPGVVVDHPVRMASSAKTTSSSAVPSYIGGSECIGGWF
jgi:hypothetical protein